MKRLDNVLYKVDKFVCTVACILMVTIVSLEVICRYCFRTTLMVGIQEIAIWCFIWMVAMGCAALMHTNGHIAVEYFVKRFCPPKLQDSIEVTTNLILIFFFISIIVTGYPFAIDQWSMRATSADIPKTFPYMAIPVSMTFMLVHTLTRTWTRFKSLFNPEAQ